MDRIPRRLALPPYHTALIDWWARDYDHVFIAYSPFFRVPGYNPATAAFGPVHTDRTDVESVIDLVENPPTRPNEAPPDFTTTIKESGEPVAWRDVFAATGGPDFATFARTAWLWTVEAKRPDRDPDIVKSLDALVRDTGLYPPEEDHLPVILEPTIARYLAAAGIEEVTLWNEHRDVSRTCRTSEFEPGHPPVSLPKWPVSALSADPQRLFMVWPWDDVSGFICLTDEMRRAVPPEDFFDGQYARPDTYVDWLNPVDFFMRKPAGARH